MIRKTYIRFVLLACPVLALLATPGPAEACANPVFQYALQNWAVSDYPVMLFHRAALSSPQQAWADDVKRSCERTDPPLNAGLTDGDLAAPDAAAAREAWAALKLPDSQLPAIVVLSLGPAMSSRMPAEPEAGVRAAWSAPLSAQTARLVRESPLRAQIVGELTAGKAAVFVLVRGGDEARDRAARKQLEERVRGIEKEHRQLADQDPDARPFQYSIQSVDRRDAAEAVFLSMAFSLSPGLQPRVDRGEPAIIALYGRGRALPPFAANDPEAMEQVMQICMLVTGACSCQIKAMQPGVDLLFAADWDALLRNRADPAPPDTTAPSGPPSLASLVPLPAAAPSPVVKTQSVATAKTGKTHALRRNLAWTAIAAIAGIVLASAGWLLLRRRS
ncbi:MAG: hypothetical protein WCI17_02300 [bacterium]